MADRTAGFVIKSSVLLFMLSLIGAENYRHNRHSPLARLNDRITYPKQDLQSHVYQTSRHDNDIPRFPYLNRIDEKISKPKTTSSPSVSAVIMLPLLHSTEDPFHADSNWILGDDHIPEAVKSPTSLESGTYIDNNELDVFNKKAHVVFTPTTAHSTHRHHHHDTTAKTQSPYHYQPHQRVRLPEAVVDSSNLTELQLTRLVNGHIKKANIQWQCNLPLPRVVRVSDFHKDTSKVYHPSCTIIHQCGYDTGCCDNTGDVCSVKESETVLLPFSIIDGVTNIESQGLLKFENHTKCHCQSESEIKQRRKGRDSTSQPVKVITTPTAPLRTCPSKYSVRHLTDGTSICDCFHMDWTCIDLKRGKTYFSKKDVKCIHNGHCSLPSCEYGRYLHDHRRCCRKKEMFSSWPKNNSR